MKHRFLIAAVIAAAMLAGAGYGLYRLGMSQGMQMASPAAPQSGSRKVLYWHDPMKPDVRFDKPGKSPFMDMALLPVYEDETADNGVAINPRIQQNLGLRTAEVVKGNLSTALTAVGNIAWNERDVALVQARSNGFVERLAVRAPLDPVKKGQALAQLYVPDWIAAQEDYLSTLRMQGSGVEALRDGARQRMLLAGMTEDQVRHVASTGKVQPRIAITAPIDGVVSELSAREGMTVAAGNPLFRINGLSTVWVNAAVPETAVARLSTGMQVDAKTPALPGQVFHGRVGAILPEVNLQTRTITARIELANPAHRLMPGMLASLTFAPAVRRDVLLAPSEAVIRTGTRVVAIIAQPDRFVPVEVKTGEQENGQTEILQGLQAGQKVVTSGQFLIDSEASLKGAIERMGGMADSGKPTPASHHGRGRIEHIGQNDITISHGPIPSLRLEPMTMPFALPANGLPDGLAEGNTVEFDFEATPADGQYRITSIAPAQEQAPAGHHHHTGDMK